jgi:hypothetical protein
MTKDINDFITIVRNKSGKVILTIEIVNKINTYQLLRELGYRKSKLDSKRIYFRRDTESVLYVSLDDIKDAFREFLVNGEFSNMPDDIKKDDVSNCYIQQEPIKENRLFDKILDDILTETEVHEYRLQLVDQTYRHQFEAKQLLLKFDEWGLKKTIDTIGAICKDNILYYKKINNNKYLIFNHFNSKDNTNDGFDCKILTYDNESHVGSKLPSSKELIKESFQLDRDFQLIAEYIN